MSETQTSESQTAGSQVEETAAPATGGRRPRDRLEQEGEIAADYLEELLEIADLDGDLDMDVEGDRATVSIVGADLPQLVGDKGEVLEALAGADPAGGLPRDRRAVPADARRERPPRRPAYASSRSWPRRSSARVKESGERESLDPMSPFERKVVHDAVAAAGLTSESEGVEPRRYVVVLPPSGHRVTRCFT